MLDGLAYLPEEDVEDGLLPLRGLAPTQAIDLVEYFDATYVTGSYRPVTRFGGTIHLRRLPARFPPHEWNVHQATLDSSHRTNNNCEAWNRRFGSLVGYSHPTVWKTIDALRLEASSVSAKIAQESVGAPPKKRTKSSAVQMQRRLESLSAHYIQGTKTMEHFLRGVAHTIRL